MQNRRVLGLNPTGGYDLNGSAGQIVCGFKIQVGKIKNNLIGGIRFGGECLPNRM